MPETANTVGCTSPESNLFFHYTHCIYTTYTFVLVLCHVLIRCGIISFSRRCSKSRHYPDAMLWIIAFGHLTHIHTKSAHYKLNRSARFKQVAFNVTHPPSTVSDYSSLKRKRPGEPVFVHSLWRNSSNFGAEKSFTFPRLYYYFHTAEFIVLVRAHRDLHVPGKNTYNSLRPGPTSVGNTPRTIPAQSPSHCALIVFAFLATAYWSSPHTATWI